ILAHDLRQPFNQILGIIDLIEVDALNAEERKEIMIGLKSSVQSTSDLVSNVLVWSKAQFAGVSINKIDLALSETVKKALLYFSIALNKKGINVNFDVPEDLRISFDKDHFESVLRNIFSNAYKFSTEGSSISIEATANFKQKRVYLSIIDQGIGMDKQQVEKIMDGSSAGDSYLGTLNEDGTGIGMIIVRDFLAENEASFTVESSLGEGTSFILNLPMA
ncbi:MAG: sensor histidine kinase, partial [Croceimicrobium sp.]